MRGWKDQRTSTAEVKEAKLAKASFQRSVGRLAAARTAIKMQQTQELIAFELRESLQALGDVIDQVVVELRLLPHVARDRSVMIAVLEVALAPDGPRRRVRIWHDEADAVEVPGDASALLSEQRIDEDPLVGS